MTADTGAWFDSFSSSDYSVVPFHVIIVVVTLLTLLLGVKSIERSNKVIYAGVGSLQNMFEAVGESLQNRFPKLNRISVLVILCVVCLGVGIHMEPIAKLGPWMDIVSIYIIPIGATPGAISWFWVMKKDELLFEINKGTAKAHGNLWYLSGRFLYVPCALILSCVALFMKIAF